LAALSGAVRAARALVAAGRSGAGAVRAFALPQRCPGCGEPAPPEAVLCAACRARIPPLSSPLCARCLLAGRAPEGCHRHPAFRVFAPWQLDDHAAAIVHALKYGGRPGIARGLGAALAAAVPVSARATDLVLEVPLHPARERERGYNQAARLADALAAAIAAPRLAGALARTRRTRPQVSLGEQARRANVSGAFAVLDPGLLHGRRVLIVDDVMTTGATLEACLTQLAAAGAKAAGVALAWTP